MKKIKGGETKLQRRREEQGKSKKQSRIEEDKWMQSIEDWMPGAEPMELGDESDVERNQNKQEENYADQRQSNEAQRTRQQVGTEETHLAKKGKCPRLASQRIPGEERPQRLFEGDFQDAISMEEEPLSQPKRQRKITEYAQMQQQKHAGTPKARGDGGNKVLGPEGEDEGTMGAVVKNAENNPTSQDNPPSL